MKENVFAGARLPDFPTRKLSPLVPNCPTSLAPPVFFGNKRLSRKSKLQIRIIYMNDQIEGAPPFFCDPGPRFPNPPLMLWPQNLRFAALRHENACLQCFSHGGGRQTCKFAGFLQPTFRNRDICRIFANLQICRTYATLLEQKHLQYRHRGVMQSHRLLCQVIIPVVPHEAVAEVSRIGNL